MKRHCSLRIDLLPGESSLTWQVFDRLTGVNGGIARTIPATPFSDPAKLVASFTTTIINACNGANQPSRASLQAWGNSTCKDFFPEEIINKLSGYDHGDILFVVPLNWADFPFEILFCNNAFLGQRYHIGTIINTKIPQGPEKQYNQEGDLMIITTPSDKLQSVCREGDSLKSSAINCKRQVKLVLQADSQKLITEIPGASIVHFAGHSGPDEMHTAAGWKVGDNHYFDTEQISKLGTSPVLPWLVFSNSCDGGRIIVNSGLSGIAGAFLSAGVQQVIGPFCKLNDAQAMRCTESFYSCLFKGKNAAQALTSLRKKSPEGTGLTPLFYRLFGDPRYKVPAKNRLWFNISLVVSSIVLFVSLLILGLNRFNHSIANSTVPAARSEQKPRTDKRGGVFIDFRIGEIMRFSVNLYAPTFIYNEPHDSKKSELHPADPARTDADSAPPR